MEQETKAMRVFTLLAVVGMGIGFLTSSASAHHSTNNIYDEEQTVEVTGVVKEWRLVNPHPYLVVEVTEPNGETYDWDLSFGGSAAGPLRRRGYTPETFTAGEVINARGNPALAEGVYGVLIRGGLTREDGTEIP
jgi:hypothetical protein